MLVKALSKLAKDWFLLGMVSAVALATLFPDAGRTGGLLRADRIADVGIFAIFFFHGLGLSTESLLRGISRWKLHLLVQAFTFVVFPLLFFVFRAAFSRVVPPDLMLGFLYLCALPSTISSSVAMTSLARGNVPAAIFNATLSNLIGILLTPLIIGLVATTTGEGLSLRHAMLNIAKLLLLPFVVGQALRPLLGRWFARYEKHVNSFDKAVILVLVYAAFCDSVKSGLWTNYGVGTLGLTFGLAALILFVVLLLSSRAARLFGFEKEDEITAVMCGSKKTLAAGVPMAKLLFGAHPALGIIVLPIMLYHQLQLFTCSILAGRYARRPAAGAGAGAGTGAPVAAAAASAAALPLAPAADVNATTASPASAAREA